MSQAIEHSIRSRSQVVSDRQSVGVARFDILTCVSDRQALVQLLLRRKASPGRASISPAPSLCALAIGDDQLDTALLLMVCLSLCAILARVPTPPPLQEHKADPNTLTRDTEAFADAGMTPLMLCSKQVAVGSKSPLVMRVAAALLAVSQSELLFAKPSPLPQRRRPTQTSTYKTVSGGRLLACACSRRCCQASPSPQWSMRAVSADWWRTCFR